MADDKALLAKLLQQSVPVDIYTKSGKDVCGLFVAAVDDDTVFLTSKHFVNDSPEHAARMIGANAVAVSLDSIEAVKFRGRNY